MLHKKLNLAFVLYIPRCRNFDMNQDTKTLKTNKSATHYKKSSQTVELSKVADERAHSIYPLQWHSECMDLI